MRENVQGGSCEVASAGTHFKGFTLQVIDLFPEQMLSLDVKASTIWLSRLLWGCHVI